ncbi:MAG: non-heme iron oxygenase ferredoxin subunit [Candidatus Eisenbacteria bacterium]|nr:non-heme iron oxygenase ferredoxin subunit [Candidatus Eisenbacteria bacterium]
MTKKFVAVAKEAEIPEGEARTFDLDYNRIALCKVGGRIFAIEDVCSHDDGPLGEGCLVDHEIECPRHGARFDVRTGGVTRMPAVAPVPTYAVRIEDGQVLVELDED